MPIFSSAGSKSAKHASGLGQTYPLRHPQGGLQIWTQISDSMLKYQCGALVPGSDRSTERLKSKWQHTPVEPVLRLATERCFQLHCSTRVQGLTTPLELSMLPMSAASRSGRKHRKNCRPALFSHSKESCQKRNHVVAVMCDVLRFV